MNENRANQSRQRWERVQQPAAEARGLPNVAYTDAAFALRERDTLLANTWTCIGFRRDLPKAPAAKPVDLLGMPLVVVSDQSDQLQVFHNVCSHRGQVLVSEACQLDSAIRCPYHSWTYRLDGSLRGTPFIGGTGVHEVEGFDKSQYGLKAVRTAEWLGMIFVNLSEQAEEFDDYLAPVRERWETFVGTAGLQAVRPAQDGYMCLDVQANWKLAVENYCESYHLPWVHPGLNSYSRLEDHYNISVPGKYAGQGTYAYDFASRAGISLPEFSAWPQDKRKHAEYVALFPNVLLGLQIDHLYAILLEPLAHDCTRERVQIYYVDDTADDESHAAARKTVLEGWREVFQEDVWAVEGLQRGRHSPGFDGGVFSPVMDQPTHTFHCWAAQRLSDIML
ncbi:MAG: Rieske 2Fe-2S domain-containing protein [Gammaproteobacteria bacterium]|nr:Rieske 2Fe-2S domain-containing protein [Gammaproteobacteria bacterium]